MADARDRAGENLPEGTTPEVTAPGVGRKAGPVPSGVDDTRAISVDQTSAFARLTPPGSGSPDAAYAPPATLQPESAAPSAWPPQPQLSASATWQPPPDPAAYGAGGPAAHGAGAPRGATAVLPQGRRSGGRGLLVGALLLGLTGGGAAGYLGGQLAGSEQEPAPRVLEAVPVGSTPATPVTAIAAHALPSVVFLSVGDGGAGVGSGFVVREDGYIVTNSHVIEGAGDDGEIAVRFTDGTEAEATVVGADVEYDIAVVKVDLDGLQVLEFGDSDQLQIGVPVVAVGAPLGLDNTVTTGIVSALNRPVIAGGTSGSTSYINAIQTDAAINPGNSGGPLLDLNGQVIGVNSAIAQIPGEMGGPAGSIGLGFAIPSRQAEHTATQLIETGTSNHPVIGVMLDMRHTGGGALVLAEGTDGADPVVADGPADRAGIQPGELILEVEGELIEHGRHLIVVLRSYSVGDEVDLRVRSVDGDERTVTLTLQGSE